MRSYPSQQRQQPQRESAPAPREVPDWLTRTPPASDVGARLAMLCYLSVPILGFFGPLVIYFASRRTPQVRWHAAQALNLWITVLLYSVCALIIGAMLALDALGVALIIVTPLAAALWLAALRCLVRAALMASRGSRYEIPAWLCATVVR
jgi:uncharacterized Tic20 family protein